MVFEVPKYLKNNNLVLKIISSKNISIITGRNSTKPVAICVAELEDVYKWGEVTIPRELLNQLLPGPVTLCFRRLLSLNERLNPNSNKNL